METHHTKTSSPLSSELSPLDGLLCTFLPDIWVTMGDEPDSWKADQIRWFIYGLQAQLSHSDGKQFHERMNEILRNDHE